MRSVPLAKLRAAADRRRGSPAADPPRPSARSAGSSWDGRHRAGPGWIDDSLRREVDILLSAGALAVLTPLLAVAAFLVRMLCPRARRRSPGLRGLVSDGEPTESGLSPFDRLLRLTHVQDTLRFLNEERIRPRPPRRGRIDAAASIRSWGSSRVSWRGPAARGSRAWRR